MGHKVSLSVIEPLVLEKDDVLILEVSQNDWQPYAQRYITWETVLGHLIVYHEQFEEFPYLSEKDREFKW